MGLGVTTDISALAILKEYYGDQEVQMMMFSNSRVLGLIKKKRITGKNVPLPMSVYGSGAVGSDFMTVIAQASNGLSNTTMYLTPGRLFSSFVMEPQEYLASQNNWGAFTNMFALRAGLAMDDMRKLLAKSFYGTGNGEQGRIVAVDSSKLYVDVQASTTMAISPQSLIMFASTPTAAYRDINAVPVLTIANQASGLTRITFSSAYAASVAVGDYVMIKGGRDSGGLPNGLVGLEAWLPTVGNRVPGSAFDTLVAQPFFGVVRSSAVDRLCGSFVKADVGESKSDAILRCMRNTLRGGGISDMILMNDEDYYDMGKEAQANRTFMQSPQGAEAKGKNSITYGIGSYQMNFSASWINNVIPDPYCDKGKAYVLDSSTIVLYSISNAGPIIDPLSTANAPGNVPKAGSQAEPTTNLQFLVDDMYTVSRVDLSTGPGIRVDFQLFGNFGVINPAHNGVVVF